MQAIAAALLLTIATASSSASSISGRVTDAESGRPIPRILVTLVPPDPDQQVDALTDENGRFAFNDVAPGRYAVSAASGEHRSTWLRQWFGDAKPTGQWGSPRRYPIDVTDGGSRTDVDIPMMRALGIEGQVIAPWEQGLVNVPVVAITTDGAPVTPNASFTDDLGHYRLYGLAPGRYRVCADARNGINGDGDPPEAPFVRTCHPASISEGTAADVTLVRSDVTGIDIRVQRTTGRTITGSVTDASGALAKGAYVSATSVDFLKGTSYVIARDGTFTISGLVPDEYHVHATIGGRSPDDRSAAARGREVGVTEVDLTAVDASGVAVTLNKSIRLPGRVRFDGAPLPASRLSRVAVHAWAVDASIILMGVQPIATVRDDLSFELADLPRLPTLIDVQGLPAGWGVARVRYQARDVTYQPTDFGAAPAPIEITLTDRLTELRAAVLNESGTAIEDSVVIAFPATAHAWRGGVTGRRLADGTVTLGPLVPGEYIVAAITRADLYALNQDRTRLAALEGLGTKVTVGGERQRSIELHPVALPERR